MINLKSLENVHLARQIAEKAHAGQTRKDGKTPYIAHVERVAQKCNQTPITIAVAWLHDVVENTEETIESLKEKGLPDEVVNMVDVLTRKENQTYREYIEKVGEYDVSKNVKITDMIDNLMDDPTDSIKERYKKALQSLMS